MLSVVSRTGGSPLRKDGRTHSAATRTSARPAQVPRSEVRVTNWRLMARGSEYRAQGCCQSKGDGPRGRAKRGREARSASGLRLVNDDLNDDVADAEDDAGGQDAGGRAVLLEDLAQEPVPLLHDLEHDRDDQDRDDAPDQGATEGAEEALDLRTHADASV